MFVSMKQRGASSGIDFLARERTGIGKLERMIHHLLDPIMLSCLGFSGEQNRPNLIGYHLSQFGRNLDQTVVDSCFKFDSVHGISLQSHFNRAIT